MQAQVQIMSYLTKQVKVEHEKKPVLNLKKYAECWF